MSRYIFKTPFLREHSFQIYDFILSRTFDAHEVNYLAEQLDLNPQLSESFFRNYTLSNKKKINAFIKDLTSESLLVVEGGRRKSGKTTLNLWLSYILLKEGYTVFYINEDIILPEQIKSIKYNQKQPYIEVIRYFYPELELKDYSSVLDWCRLNKNKRGKVIIFHDECHKDLPKNFSSKDGDILRSFWAELRKIFKQLIVVYTSQTMSGMPVQLFNYADIQIYKNFRYLQLQNDRRELIGNIEFFIPRTVSETLVISDDIYTFENPMVNLEDFKNL